jgi:hypothetical protein
MHVYLTPGKSREPPPRTKTEECGLILWPTPGKWATTHLLLVSIIFAVGLLAEFGFLGVTILALFTAPFTCGQFFNAAALWCAFFLMKVFCLIVKMLTK